MPVIASVAMRKVLAVSGIFFARPPMFRMSVSSAMPCITEPAPRKRQALKKAWVTRCRTPASYAPAPTPMNMYPSCETVEYARTFLMSVCAKPMIAAKSAVAAPTSITTAEVAGASANRYEVRAMRYTPAVTIVAAWMRADTGVGPAIASGSHT